MTVTSGTVPTTSLTWPAAATALAAAFHVADHGGHERAGTKLAGLVSSSGTSCCTSLAPMSRTTASPAFCCSSWRTAGSSGAWAGPPSGSGSVLNSGVADRPGVGFVVRNDDAIGTQVLKLESPNSDRRRRRRDDRRTGPTGCRPGPPTAGAWRTTARGRPGLRRPAASGDKPWNGRRASGTDSASGVLLLNKGIGRWQRTSGAFSGRRQAGRFDPKKIGGQAGQDASLEIEACPQQHGVLSGL